MRFLHPLTAILAIIVDGINFSIHPHHQDEEKRKPESYLFTKQKVKVLTDAGLTSMTEVEHKTSYWGTILLGTPAQEFTVIFDTGSGNLILPAEGCDMPGCNSHHKYKNDGSSTSETIINEKGRGSAKISFGTGDIEGQFYKDKMCIGGILCTDVNFIGSTKQSTEPFQETPFDGILGLGFKDLSMGNHFNIIDDFVKQSQIPSGQFSVYLDDTGSSSITFGGVNTELLASPITWAPVNHLSYWQIAIDDITFDNKMTGLCKDGCQVAVDTGTSMLAGPSDMVDALSEKINLKEDCSNFHELPDIGFQIGDKVLNLRPEDYADNGPGGCQFSLMSLDVPPPKGPLFIFGDPFLRRFVTVFDRKQNRVGFAVAKKEHTIPNQVISTVHSTRSDTASFLARDKMSNGLKVNVPLTETEDNLQNSSKQRIASDTAYVRSIQTSMSEFELVQENQQGTKLITIPLTKYK